MRYWKFKKSKNYDESVTASNKLHIFNKKDTIKLRSTKLFMVFGERFPALLRLFQYTTRVQNMHLLTYLYDIKESVTKCLQEVGFLITTGVSATKLRFLLSQTDHVIHYTVVSE